jgi:molybdopterin-guanine dinucleotide biosynthesis protein A
MSASAIVLAGGRSSRFGRDKLAEPIDGRPLLARAVEASATVVDEVIVVLAPEGAEPDLGMQVRFVRDTERFGGPLVGLAAGLEAATHERVVVVGGDMPRLIPAVLRLLLDHLAAAAATALADEDGVVRPLPMGLRRLAALDAARRMVAGGRRGLLLLLDDLSVDIITGSDWRALDPEGATLRDIDRPADIGPAGAR